MAGVVVWDQMGVLLKQRIAWLIELQKKLLEGKRKHTWKERHCIVCTENSM
ncbi:hypothetical protein Golax_020499 [Gossypium laxum]|uniref:Uncharacterized protein n=1 Tax=Gossypium laxum TaxID=34288 RepID=A0A7J9B0X8_9ROSI|nr:hypothetical protein [Gossypium laxum]